MEAINYKLVVSVLLVMSLLNASDTVMVLDGSGSMIYNQSQMKLSIDKGLKKGFSAIGFGSEVYPINKTSDYIIDGSTAMSKALNYIDKNLKDVQYSILVSDGAPDRVALTEEAAQRLHSKGIKICSSFIGDGDIPQVLFDISDVVFKSDIDSAISKCTGRVKQELIGAAIVKDIDENAFSF